MYVTICFSHPPHGGKCLKNNYNHGCLDVDIQDTKTPTRSGILIVIKDCNLFISLDLTCQH